MPDFQVKMIEVVSPIKGDDKTSAREQQDPMGFVWDSVNVLPYDRFGRKRVAQRSGLSPLFQNSTSTTSAVLGMLQVNQIVYPGQGYTQVILPPITVISTASSTTTGLIFTNLGNEFAFANFAATGTPYSSAAPSTSNQVAAFQFYDSGGHTYGVTFTSGLVAGGSQYGGAITYSIGGTLPATYLTNDVAFHSADSTYTTSALITLNLNVNQTSSTASFAVVVQNYMIVNEVGAVIFGPLSYSANGSVPYPTFPMGLELVSVVTPAGNQSIGQPSLSLT
jgi:hypothetical protein